MWKYFLLLVSLSASTSSFQLNDLLSTAEMLFEEFYSVDGNSVDSEEIKLMVRRTYDLHNEHKISRRSDDKEMTQDVQGLFLLSNVQDMSKIPVKFPNDINIFSSNNLLYIAALEANQTDPENQLANDLVLFHYSSIQGIKELARVPVLGATKVAVHLFRNTTYLVAAEYEAKENPDFYQGSVVYRLVESRRRVYLEKVQILNVIRPNDVKFFQHQDQLYLFIGTDIGSDGQRTGTLIYRWLGHHFDCLQVIPSGNVKSVTPFAIGSFMFLAVANFQDKYGNVDVDSEVFKFNIQEMKFKPFQKIRTHGARHFAHFNFEDAQNRENEHFLIVANSLGKNSPGNLSSLKESVIYKFSDNRFIPFQSFKLHGATQWLPIKGPSNEFLLLVSHANGVDGYQYDGWRFTPVSLQFGQSFFGSNIQSMRAFYYFGDLFLTIADKSSYGNSVNLWKLSFTNRNDFNAHITHVETWCNRMNENLTEDDFDEVIQKFSSVLNGTSKEFEPKLKGENYLVENSNEEVRDELERLNEKLKNLENMLKEAADDVDKHMAESEVPIVFGSREMASLELRCSTENCCQFKKAKIIQLNDENFPDFLSNTVSLSEGLSDSVLEFEHVVLESDVSSPMVNGRPSETLIDVSSTTLINGHLTVNGTVFINDDLKANGLFDGNVPDAQHMLLSDGAQNIQDVLVVNELTVENLSLLGRLNGQFIEGLLRKPNINLGTSYQELNVNNMLVEGLVGGYNLSEIFEKAVRKKEKMEIQGNVNINSLEAEEIRVDSQQISNLTISEILTAFEDRQCPEDSSSDVDSNSLGPEYLESKSSDSKESGATTTADEYVVIVEGVLKANDLSDETNSTSLLHIVNESVKLDESVIDSDFHFSNIVTEDFDVDIVNNVPASSWVLKNSPGTHHIRGKKRFMSGVRITEEVYVDQINGVNLEELERDVLKLEGDQIIRAHLKFNTVNCEQITTNSTNIGKNKLDKMNRLELQGSVLADRLEVENLTISGDIDSLSWSDIVKDFVYENDHVSGQKTLMGVLRADNFNITGRINDLYFEEFVALTSADANKVVLDRNVTLNRPLNVEELHFQGLLDFALSPTFDREWLLQDETQIITGPVTFENLHIKSGANLMNETVNNVDLRKLFARSIKVNEDTKIKHLFTLGQVAADHIDTRGTINGADFNESILRSESGSPQTLTGDWFLSQGLTVNGSLVLEGNLSGLNLTQLCNVKRSDKPNLIVGGSVKLQREPIITSRVNGFDLSETGKDLWIADQHTTLRGHHLRFHDVSFHGPTTLEGFLSAVNLTDLSRLYLSRTQPRLVSEDFQFEDLLVRKGCRMRTARVGGLVNGLRLPHWTNNVLLQEEDQVIGERLRFERLHAENLQTLGTVNGLDLSKEVLRLDVQDAVVEGEKTFETIHVLNLTLGRGKRLQGVDTDDWREKVVRGRGDVVVKGDLTLEKPLFNGAVRVVGRVNEMEFDSKHLLTSGGEHVVVAPKHFEYKNRSDSGMRMRSLEVSGAVGGVELSELMKKQAYSDRNLVFEKPKTFGRGLVTDSMEVDGLFHGVNVSGMCNDVFNPVDVNVKKEEILGLLEQTETLIGMVKDRVFYLDYMEVIQTMKPNVKAVVPTLDSRGNHLLAMFTSNAMSLMEWNEYSGTFVHTGEGLNLSENITFVASEIWDDNSFVYLETNKSGKILTSKQLKEIQATETSCVASFQLKALNKSCIFLGQKWNSSRILCNSVLMNDLQTYQWLESRGSVQVAVLTIEDETFIAVINKEMVFDRIENTLSIYRFDAKLQHFYVSHTLAEINPVALSSVSYKNNHYLVSAGGHLPESVHNSVLSIFKFNKRHKVFVRSQSIQVGTPVDVHFAILPSSQLALYVLTSNPTKPFVVFLHRGISAFVEETSGLSLYPGSYLHSFTDSRNNHFVIINGFGRGQVLKAGFKGQNLPPASSLSGSFPAHH